ncbi:hypothetical protein HD806DRAFT_486086, partial [Xylariaceae sp. AK1471]
MASWTVTAEAVSSRLLWGGGGIVWLWIFTRCYVASISTSICATYQHTYLNFTYQLEVDKESGKQFGVHLPSLAGTQHTHAHDSHHSLEVVMVKSEGGGSLIGKTTWRLVLLMQDL